MEYMEGENERMRGMIAGRGLAGASPAPRSRAVFKRLFFRVPHPDRPRGRPFASGAILLSLSTVIVAVNAALLRISDKTETAHDQGDNP